MIRPNAGILSDCTGAKAVLAGEIWIETGVYQQHL